MNLFLFACFGWKKTWILLLFSVCSYSIEYWETKTKNEYSESNLFCFVCYRWYQICCCEKPHLFIMWKTLPGNSHRHKHHSYIDFVVVVFVPNFYRAVAQKSIFGGTKMMIIIFGDPHPDVMNDGWWNLFFSSIHNDDDVPNNGGTRKKCRVFFV